MQVTQDGFLGNRVMVRQPASGFRSGADAVLLAASVPASASQSVLELGLGAGAASLCLASRVKGLRLTGLEVQDGYADLARQNADANGIELNVHIGNITKMPSSILDQTFDHVFMNPPIIALAAGPNQTPLTSRQLSGNKCRFPRGWTAQRGD